MIKYFDFHTHLDFYKDEELDDVIRTIIKNNIRVFSASVNIKSYERNLFIKKRLIEMNAAFESLLSVSFGVHPSYCKDLPVKENEALNLLKPFYKNSEIISESGLDFYWEKECPKSVQKMHLQIALDHANENKKVIVLHTKGAEKEIYEMLQDFPHAKPVIHWYDGPENIYKKFLDKGYPETFGCELKYAEHIKKFLKITPFDLILPETDNPTGEPWLGGTDSSPLLIKRIYKDIAEVKDISEEELSVILENNLERLLKK